MSKACMFSTPSHSAKSRYAAFFSKYTNMRQHMQITFLLPHFFVFDKKYMSHVDMHDSASYAPKKDKSITKNYSAP